MSVLKEANPKSLDDIYNADPLGLTDDNLDELIDDWRNKRHLWEREEKAAQSEGRNRKKSYREAPKPGQLSLGSLGLGKATSNG